MRGKVSSGWKTPSRRAEEARKMLMEAWLAADMEERDRRLAHLLETWDDRVFGGVRDGCLKIFEATLREDEEAVADGRAEAASFWSAALRRSGIEWSPSTQEAFEARVAVAEILAEEAGWGGDLRRAGRSLNDLLQAVYDPKLTAEERAAKRLVFLRENGLSSDPILDHLKSKNVPVVSDLPAGAS